MRISTDHQTLPDASEFADILKPGLVAHATSGDRTLSFSVVQLPDLRVPTGKVCASDGYILEAEPFKQVIVPGAYPVFLAIADIDSDERVAFAKLRFAPVRAASWGFATLPGQDPILLKKDEIYGYGVDSGTGCFGDSEAYRLVREGGEELAEKMMANARDVHRDTRGWVTVEAETGSLAVFSSGLGDGFYASYFGYSERGDVVSLMTDFGIAEWAARPKGGGKVRRRYWGHPK